MDNQGLTDKGVSASHPSTQDLDLIQVYAPEDRGEWQVKKLPLSNSDVWVCQISEDLLICFHNRAKKQILEHAIENATETVCREVGGALIGSAYRYGKFRFIEITAAICGNFTRGSAARLTFTADTWSEIIRVAEAEYKDQHIVGWYHTHPNLGVFLSELDLDIQNNFFDQPDQVALVIDPINKKGGFFYGTQKNNGRVLASEHFTWDHTLYFPSTVRQASREVPLEPSREEPRDSSILRRIKVSLLGRPQDSGRGRNEPIVADVKQPILRVTAADIQREVKSPQEEDYPSQSAVFGAARESGFTLSITIALVLLMGGSLFIILKWNAIEGIWNSMGREFAHFLKTLQSPGALLILFLLLAVLVVIFIALLYWYKSLKTIDEDIVKPQG